MLSPEFTVEILEKVVEIVPEVVNIEDKLLKTPESEYELELGKDTQLDLLKYQSDSSMIFVTYRVTSTSQTSSTDTTENLASIFRVEGLYKGE